MCPEAAAAPGIVELTRRCCGGLCREGGLLPGTPETTSCRGSGRPGLSDAAVTAWPKRADPSCDHNPGLSEGRQDGPVAERVCSGVSLPVPALPSPTTAGLCRELGRHFLGGLRLPVSELGVTVAPVTHSARHTPRAQQVRTPIITGAGRGPEETLCTHGPDGQSPVPQGEHP